jgi:hypothetical protein
VSRSTLAGAIIALALVACAVFIGVAVHELDYASEHPFRYGPAKVIAAAAGAGALLSLAVAMLGYAHARGRA